MSVIPQMLYSVDELASLSSGFENTLNKRIYELIDTVDNGQYRTAIKNRHFIVQHLETSQLKLPSYYYDPFTNDYGFLSSGLECLLESLKLGKNVRRDYQGTKQIIPVENIIAWADEFNIEINIANPKAPTTTPKTDVTAPPTWVNDVQKLLAGTHKKQPPELAEAIKIWLDVIHDPDFNTRNITGSIIQRYFGDDPTQSKAKKERISAVVNWNKEGNRKRFQPR